MRRFLALNLFSGHRGHPGLSAALSVGEEYTLAPGTVRMETTVQAVHWYIIFSLSYTLLHLSSRLTQCPAGIQLPESPFVHDNSEAFPRGKHLL